VVHADPGNQVINGFFRRRARGWCYILENRNALRKGDFDVAEKLETIGLEEKIAGKIDGKTIEHKPSVVEQLKTVKAEIDRSSRSAASIYSIPSRPTARLPSP
jgi:hypothetical protein